MNTEKMYLALQNGMVFEGKSFGASNDVVGEIVFTTGMTGYIETLTDPSYFGQMVIQTFPLIGNYGIIPSDFESKKSNVKAYIVREWCQHPSNFRNEGTLDTFLKEQGITGIYDLDTRCLTKIIREHGVMNGIICKQKPDAKQIEALSAYKITDAVKSVTCNEVTKYQNDQAKFQVVLMDFGYKKSILKGLEKYGCAVTVVPSYTTADEILSLKPDGVMLSNGPGDPLENTAIIEELKKLVAKKMPIFGICLGHQLLAIANGARTVKLKYGHRGSNQPVKDILKDRVYITSQNHGYAVVEQTINKELATLSHFNVNDDTVEGIHYKNAPAFSVQFHPEASAGPLDTEFLFLEFVELMERGEHVCL